MQIRQKLTYLFAALVALVLLVSLAAIYILSADYRRDDFYDRLRSKSSNTAKLLIEVDEVDVGLLRKIETANPSSLPLEKITIYDDRNDILFSTDEDKIIQVNPALLEKIRKVGEMAFLQDDYEILGYTYADREDHFVVVAAAVDIYGLKKLKNLRMVMALVFGASVVLVLFLGRVFAGRALNPISKVVGQVKRITISSLNLRVDEGNHQDEVAKLAQTFNEMLGRLEEAFNMQKNFIANASHELRTPLTAITGQLEVLMMRDRSTEEYKKTVASVLEDMKSLNMISNRLLLLAQASTEKREGDFKPVRIDDVLWQVRSEVIRRQPESQVEITLDETLESEEQLTVDGIENLLKSALQNLMENGCKYSSNHTVRVHVSTSGAQLLLSFSDQGIGIPKEDLRRIFEPFHRGKNTAGIPGHGIGLSIVDRIVKLHSGELSVVSIQDQGSTFTVRFPPCKTEVIQASH
ncbi:MAG: HAMP domain-containing histidine kinase [Flavobacteriales bacterium]|nr:HAMP domain-containing histidine kinase [Flavobacteriales bacterium]